MLELARVVAIHPHDHSIDALLLRTGQHAIGVPVLAAGAGSLSGLSDLPPVNAPGGDARWGVLAETQADAIAVLCPTASRSAWIVVGFLFPQLNAVLHQEPGRAIYRHSSGAWHSIGPDGTVTLGHPSGAVLSFGSTTPHVPQGVDARWPDPTGAPAGARLTMPSGAQITIAPDGRVTLKAITEAVFDTPLATFTGAITAAGNIETTADVKAGNINLKTHRHPNGNPQTGQPIP